jgi:hypothetical protein
MADRRIEFTFDCDGARRRVLSIIERGNGNVIINNLPKGSARLKRTPNEPLAYKQVRYSVHPTETVPFANSIKRTEELEDGTMTESHYYTLGIKVTDKFIPIFVQRYDQLNDPCYDLAETDAETEKLGDCTHIFGLMLSVFVGPPRPFVCAPDDYQFRQFKFAGFGLVIAWSFFLAPQMEGFERYPYTTKETGARTTASDEECVEIFKEYRQATRDDLVAVLSRIPQWRLLRAIAEIPFYFREGRIGAERPAFQRHMLERGVMRMVNGQPMLYVDVR